MSKRLVEWKMALDASGISKSIKGIDSELSDMRAAFDQLEDVKAFEKQLDSLQELSKKLDAARTHADSLAAAAETGGKSAQAAYARAQAQVAKLEEALKTQTSATAASAAELEKAGVSTKNLAAETQRLEQQFAAATEATAKAAEIQEAWGLVGVKSTADITEEIEKLQQVMASGLLDERGIAAAQDRIAALNEELGETVEAAEETGGAFDVMSTKLMALAAATLTVKKAKEAVVLTSAWSDELQAVAAYTGATVEEMAKLEQKSLDLAGAAGGPRAVAAAMAELATAGLNASQILGTTGIVRDMSAASKGSLDFAAAGSLLTDVMQQMGFQMDKAAPVADRMVKSWASASQSATDLGGGLLEVGSTYASLYRHLGQTAALEKAASLISVLADVGFKASRGGTAAKAALTRLIAPAGAGAKVLEKYKDVIKIFDDVGNMRDFADIIDDIAAAGLSAQESSALWGDTASAAMQALVAKGGNALREFEKALNSADGTAAKVQETLQAGLGGSMRTAAAETEKVTIKLTREFAPALQYIYGLSQYADPLADGFIAIAKGIGSAVATISQGLYTVPALLEKITGGTGYWQDKMLGAQATAKGLSGESYAAFKRLGGVVDEVAEAQKRLDASSATIASRFGEISNATGVTISTMEELDAAIAAGTILWDDATANWVGAEKQKQEASAASALIISKEAERLAELEEDARKVAEKAWENYNKKIDDITINIVKRTTALEVELAKMARSGMSAAEAQAALRKEAEEGLAAAEKFAAAGRYDEAVAAADRAKDAWGGVAGNVGRATSELDKSNEQLKSAEENLKKIKAEAKKSGPITEKDTARIKDAEEKIKELKAKVKDNTAALQESQAALQDSMTGVKTAGELAISILAQQQAAVQKNADDLNKAFDFSTAVNAVDDFIENKIKGLTNAADEAADSIQDSFSSAADASVAAAERITDAINKIPDNKTTTHTIREVQARADGGLIQGFASGGSPAFRRLSSPYITAGSGQRDDVPAMLMKNEYVLRAAAVHAPDLHGDGLALASAHNKGDWDQMRNILNNHLPLPSGPALSFRPAGPGGGGLGTLPNFGTLQLQIGGVQAEVYAPQQTAALIQQAIASQQRAAERTAQAQKKSRGRI
jgi:TP901 family phage tail tape measure protein